jgi:hypothetical protein
VPILFRFKPAMAPVTVPPPATATPPSTLDAVVVEGAELVVAARCTAIGGCGEAIAASAAVESAGAGRGEEIKLRGGAESGECALNFPSHQCLA